MENINYDLYPYELLDVSHYDFQHWSAIQAIKCECHGKKIVLDDPVSIQLAVRQNFGNVFYNDNTKDDRLMKHVVALKINGEWITANHYWVNNARFQGYVHWLKKHLRRIPSGDEINLLIADLYDQWWTNIAHNRQNAFHVGRPRCEKCGKVMGYAAHLCDYVPPVSGPLPDVRDFAHYVWMKEFYECKSCGDVTMDGERFGKEWYCQKCVDENAAATNKAITEQVKEELESGYQPPYESPWDVYDEETYPGGWVEGPNIVTPF